MKKEWKKNEWQTTSTRNVTPFVFSSFSLSAQSKYLTYTVHRAPFTGANTRANGSVQNWNKQLDLNIMAYKSTRPTWKCIVEDEKKAESVNYVFCLLGTQCVVKSYNNIVLISFRIATHIYASIAQSEMDRIFWDIFESQSYKPFDTE